MQLKLEIVVCSAPVNSDIEELGLSFEMNTGGKKGCE